MSLKLSSPVTRVVKNSEKNYKQEITYQAVTAFESAEDSPAVAMLREVLGDIAAKYEAKFGKLLICDILRSDAAIEGIFALAPQSTAAVRAAGFTPVVAEAAPKDASGI